MSSKVVWTFPDGNEFPRRRLFIYLTLSKPRRRPSVRKSASALLPLCSRVLKIFSTGVSVKLLTCIDTKFGPHLDVLSVFSEVTLAQSRMQFARLERERNFTIELLEKDRVGCRTQSQ